LILLPIHDENPVRRVPWITGLLVATNVAVFGWQLAAGGSAAIGRWGFVPANFSALPAAPGHAPTATLLTSMFLHGNLLHLASNLVYLWVFGNNVEDVLGGARYVVFYLLAGLGGHFAHFLTNGASPLPTIGASGAISGILAAYLIGFPRARIRSLLFLFVFLRWVRWPATVVIGYWLAVQILNGAAEIGGAGSGIAWFEHLGGFAAGGLAFPVLRLGRRRR
jgi:membrane associated rhomboid family serine protease